MIPFWIDQANCNIVKSAPGFGESSTSGNAWVGRVNEMFSLLFWDKLFSRPIQFRKFVLIWYLGGSLNMFKRKAT